VLQTGESGAKCEAMRKTILTAGCILALASCKKSETTTAVTALPPAQNQSVAATNEPPGPEIDPCSFLTSDQIQAILGEPLKDVRRNEKIEGILLVTQCFFELPTVSNSAVLTVTQKSSAAEARDPKDVWAETFTGGKNAAGSTGRKKVKPPRAVEGLGDGAFWAGNPKIGSLYVLKGNAYFRISIGGNEGPEVKIEKCKALAQKVLEHSF